MIFEDEASMRRILEFVCERRGYEVFTFPDPGVCPLHVMPHCPCPAGTICADIIISDITMPQVNGLDFVEALGTKQCAVPQVALMSGGWSDADRARAARLGCQLFTKPFSIAQVEAWLDTVEPVIAPMRQLVDWDAQRLQRDPPTRAHEE
jgi:DNA-binding response OmpR family regulator